jgi:hypothetical protein
MVSVKAIYDGQQLRLLEPVAFSKPQEVIVVFLNLNQEKEDISGKQIAHLISTNEAFDFLNEPEEDIYSDSDLKIRY